MKGIGGNRTGIATNHRKRAAKPKLGRACAEALERRMLLTVIAWDGGPMGTGTNWADSVNWVGDVKPGPGDDAVINATGSPITFNGTESVNSVTTSRSISINSGLLSVAATTQIAADLTLAGGTLKGSTVVATNGANVVASSFGGVLDGVILSSNATIGNGTSLYIKNGLTLDNATVSLASSGDATILYFYGGNQSLSGTGQVVLGGTSSNNYIKLGYATGPTTLIVGSGITIHGRGSLYGSTATYDLNNDWSTAQNPNGPWSYNYAGSPITAKVSSTSVSGWGYFSSFDASITKILSADYGFNDGLPGDVVIHVTSIPYGGNSSPMSIAWTAPWAGTIDVSGQAWDAQFFDGRDAGWTLSLNGAPIATHSTIFGLHRTDPAADFASDILPGQSLNGLAVNAGDVLRFSTFVNTFYGHFMGVDFSVNLTAAGSSPSTLINLGTISADIAA